MLFRRVYFMARDEWLVPVQAIKWSKLAQPEGKPRVRELRVEEQADFFRGVDQDFVTCCLVAIATGLRLKNFAELKWSEVDLLSR